MPPDLSVWLRIKRRDRKRGVCGMKGTNCEECAYFTYDEEYDSYECEFAIDEDEAARASYYGERYVCPHFQYQDEYRVVRSQMK